MFLLRIAEKKLATKDYVFLFPDNLPDEGQDKIWVDYGSVPDGNDALAKSAFKYAFAVSKHKIAWLLGLTVKLVRKCLQIEYEQIDVNELHFFKQRVPRIMSEWPFYYKSDLDNEQYVRQFFHQDQIQI